MVPRMCARESPTSSTDTPDAPSDAISRSSFETRFVSMIDDFDDDDFFFDARSFFMGVKMRVKMGKNGIKKQG